MSIEKFFMVNADELTRDVVVSDRFKDADGEPVMWTIRAISEDRNKALKSKYTKNGKIDLVGYEYALIVESVVTPDLKNAELQDFYGVFSPEELISKLLLAGEYARLNQEIMDLNGFTSLAEKVKEVKNG